MFNIPLFKGELVRLAAPTPDDDAIMAKWTTNDEYLRLADGDPARPLSEEQMKAFNQGIETKDSFGFRIRTLEADKLIGAIGLFRLMWTHQSAEVGIVIGEPDYWGKGYGSDAMRLILRYAFHELNLHRVSLQVMGYNTRACRAYEKVGFMKEGIQRQAVKRIGQRWDVINYAIVYDEWLATQA